MNWQRLFLSVAVVSCCGCAWAKGEFRVDVTPRAYMSGVAEVGFSITYEGHDSIVAERATLPGGRIEPIRFHVEGYAVDDAEIFHACPAPEQRLIIDDGAIGEVRIAPGQTLTHVIDLRKNISNLKEILGKCDLVLYWTFRPLLKGMRADRAAGAVVIPASLKMEPSKAVTMEVWPGSTRGP